MTWFRIGKISRLFVKVTPNAPRDVIEGPVTLEDSERLVVRVQAPPDKGKANKAVCALLAKTLGIPKSTLKILTGEKSRFKTLAVYHPLNATDLTALFRS